MIRKVVGSDNKACCFGIPLLLKEDGTKFGKSEKGAIFLDANITPPFQMYQFFINQPDSEVEQLLKKFTFFSKEQIINIVEQHTSDPKLRIGQKAIAKEVLTDIHGIEVFNKCAKIADALFTNNLDSLSNEELYEGLSSANSYVVNADEINVLDALVNSGLVSSKGDARRLVEQNAISVNNTPVSDIAYNLTKANGYDNKFSYIKKGKKEYCLIEWK
jgi:tyrosyl-tRNA synthetase